MDQQTELLVMKKPVSLMTELELRYAYNMAAAATDRIYYEDQTVGVVDYHDKMEPYSHRMTDICVELQDRGLPMPYTIDYQELPPI